MQVSLYKEINPNGINAVHYYYSSFSNFETAIASKLVHSYTLDNYRLNQQQIKIKLDDYITLQNFDSISYLIEKDGNYKRCYFVDSSFVQSGYVLYNVSIDYWGSYIDKAKFSEIFVNRCNRNLGLGLYKYDEFINGTRTTNFFASQYWSSSSYTTLIVISYTTYALGQQVLNSKRISKTEIFAKSGTPENSLDYIGSIYATQGILFNDLPAQVLGVYVVPSSLVNITSSTWTFKTNLQAPLDTITLNRVEIGEKSTNFNLSMDHNKKYYVGAKNNYMELTNYTSSVNIEYKCQITTNDVKMIVSQGNLSKDISEAFSVDFTFDSNQELQQDKIKRALGGISLIASGVSQLGGGPVGVISGTTRAISGIDSLFPLTPKAQLVNGGSGLITAERHESETTPIVITYDSPYTYITFELPNVNGNNISYNGAFFNIYVSTIDSIFNISFLNPFSTETFIQLEANIEGICEEARNIIQQHFNQGVHILKV